MLIKAGTAAVLLASSVFGAAPNLDQMFNAQDAAVLAARATTTTSAKHSHSTSSSVKHSSSSSVSSKSKSASRSSLALTKTGSASHSKSTSTKSAESESEVESETKTKTKASESKARSSAKSSSTKARSSTSDKSKSHSASTKSSSVKASSAKSTKSSSIKAAHSSKSSSSTLRHKSASSSSSAAATTASASESEADAATATESDSATASASTTPRSRFAFAHHHGRGMERKLRSTMHKERDAAALAEPVAEVRQRELALMKRLADDHGFRAAPEASRLRRRDADANDVGQAVELVARSAGASVAATASPAAAVTSAVAKAVSSGYWQGASSYYLHAMADAERYAVLDALADGGFKVVRIFIASVGANNKGSNSRAVNDVEPSAVGTYDDTILDLVDQLMYDCSVRGLKLLIALGDRYALGWWSTDAYAQQLGIVKAGSTGAQQVTDASAFYTSAWAAAAWDARMAHILAHKNSLLGNKPWSQLGDVVYAFEPQNEPQGHMDLVSSSWVCSRAAKLQSVLASAGSSILVSSGGGITTTTSLGSSFTSCSALDVISVHDYGTDAGTTASALVAAQKAVGDDKLVIMGEWGATGTNKATIVKNFVSAFKAAGIPQMVWEVIDLSKGAADFEIEAGSSADSAWVALTGGSVVAAASSYSSSSSSSSSASWSKSTTAKSSSTTAQWHSTSASASWYSAAKATASASKN